MVIRVSPVSRHSIPAFLLSRACAATLINRFNFMIHRVADSVN